LLLACAPFGPSIAAREEPRLDPSGIWACVAYANRILEDQRFALHLTPAGRTLWARQYATSMGRWAAISDWVADDGRLTFTDFTGGREFAAPLTRATLGGLWRSGTATGGWWCVRREDAVAAETRGPYTSAAEFFVPPLIPDISATPTYPRQAIRDAKEGRAVACFLVDASGTILEPEILELSDEVFRYPTMVALYRSRYFPGGTGVRPGCRSYMYQLDAAY
jgi:hypothetical protein